MDLFALGTPVVDLFARVDNGTIRSLGITKGATNYFSAEKLAAIERRLGKKIAYRYAGDNARNVCEGLAALGGFAGYQGAVGDDKDAAYFAANLQDCGIADFLEERKGITGRIIALVTPDGERTFCAHLGVSDSASRFEKYAVASSRMFFVTSITICAGGRVPSLALRYLEAFKTMGRKIAISLENPPMVAQHRRRLLPICKKYADVLFANEDEARALLGAGLERKLLRFKWRVPLYLKMGKKGSALFLGGKRHKIAAVEGKILDTTGGSGRLGSMLASAIIGKIGPSVPLAHTRIRIRHRHRR